MKTNEDRARNLNRHDNKGANKYGKVPCPWNNGLKISKGNTFMH